MPGDAHSTPWEPPPFASAPAVCALGSSFGPPARAPCAFGPDSPRLLCSCVARLSSSMNLPRPHPKLTFNPAASQPNIVLALTDEDVADRMLCDPNPGALGHTWTAQDFSCWNQTMLPRSAVAPAVTSPAAAVRVAQHTHFVLSLTRIRRGQRPEACRGFILYTLQLYYNTVLQYPAPTPPHWARLAGFGAGPAAISPPTKSSKHVFL